MYPENGSSLSLVRCLHTFKIKCISISDIFRVGKCVGYHNYKYFLLFLVHLTFTCCYGLIMIFVKFENAWKGTGKIGTYSFSVLNLLIVMASFSIYAIILIVTHIILISRVSLFNEQNGTFFKFKFIFSRIAQLSRHSESRNSVMKITLKMLLIWGHIGISRKCLELT
jgi:tryptophan-rich sensory protein